MNKIADLYLVDAQYVCFACDQSLHDFQIARVRGSVQRCVGVLIQKRNRKQE